MHTTPYMGQIAINKELRSKGIHAVRWSFVDKVSKYALVFLSTVLLARLLTPTAFGLVSMLYIYVNIAGIFVDSGMGGAITKKIDLSSCDCSTFFYFNIIIGLIIYFLLYLVAPVIAVFYKQP